MAKMTPQEHAALWAQKFGGSAAKYTQGVQRVTQNPAQKAIAAQDRLVANFNQSVADGKWAAGLGKVTLQSWQQAATEKGAPQLATSARLAADKVAKAEAMIAPIRDSIVASLPPRGSIEDNIQRASEMARKMYEARRRG